MEKNNGRNEQEIDVQQLVKEAQDYKNAANKLYQRVQQLESTWLINRATFLFKLIETKGFSEECKQKAIEELEGFLFPVTSTEKDTKEV